jgi:hypothetical protein
MGPRTGLDTVVKRKIPNPRRESNPRTPIVQPVVQGGKKKITEGKEKRRQITKKRK